MVGMVKLMPAIATPFSAYHSLALLSNYDHVIPDADARFHDMYNSLHFFAKRWGVAGKP
jgi:hypothetical protein